MDESSVEFPMLVPEDQPNTNPGQTSQTFQPEVPVSVPAANEAVADSQPAKLKVIEAPATIGPCFRVKKERSPGIVAGQMMALIDRFNPRGAMIVMKTYLPSPSDSGYTSGVEYLGARVDRRYQPVLINMKIEDNGPLMYRLTNPKGHPWRYHGDWEEMDLSVIKLRTTDDQKAAISAFAGIVYKASSSVPNVPKGQFIPKKKFIGILDAAGVSARQLKDKLK
jgi:hypothetical protein